MPPETLLLVPLGFRYVPILFLALTICSQVTSGVRTCFLALAWHLSYLLCASCGVPPRPQLLNSHLAAHFHLPCSHF